MTTDPTDPAFNVYSMDHLQTLGLTKREYFAAMAMQGICAIGHLTDGAESTQAKARALDAVLMADALIAELNGGGDA